MAWSRAPHRCPLQDPLGLARARVGMAPTDRTGQGHGSMRPVANNLVRVTDLPVLAREIIDAHQQITSHAKGMLLEAKRAGEALLAVKKECPHGSFEEWVRSNTR